ncbi:MAG: hypothetical protein EAY68_02810 [Bacteroidetes bacterium]|nr:MAG: hypothetical protein EAY68_02810 [Bacteroidota bacterium]
MKGFALLVGLWLTLSGYGQQQKDTLQQLSLFTKAPAAPKVDTVPTKRKRFDRQAWLLNHNPRTATRRSALIPGWGQIYNRDYWKLPIVYGGLAIPISLFFYNNTWYNRTRTAFDIRVSNDTGRFGEIHPDLVNLSPTSLQFYRNSFRQGRDYSILWTLLVWGLNVVDATVFGHLKHFDVSDNLSLQVNPQYMLATNTPGLSLVITQKDKKAKPLKTVK